MPGPGCYDAGCAGCRYGNGGVHGDEGDGDESWGVLGWCPRCYATSENNFIR